MTQLAKNLHKYLIEYSSGEVKEIYANGGAHALKISNEVWPSSQISQIKEIDPENKTHKVVFTALVND